MSKRMQVLFDPPEYRQIVRVAKAKGMTVSAWVRQTLREAAAAEPVIDRGRKLAAIRAAAGCSFPTADITPAGVTAWHIRSAPESRAMLSAEGHRPSQLPSSRSEPGVKAAKRLAQRGQP